MINTLIIVIPLLVFIAVMLLIYTLLYSGGQVQTNRRRQDLRPRQDASSVSHLLSMPALDRLIRPALRRVAGAIGGRAPGNLIAATEAQLVKAGRPFGLSAEAYLTLRLLVLGAALAGAYGLAMGPLAASIYRLPVAGFLVVIGALLPIYVIEKRIEHRHAEIRKTLPDIIDLLVVSVEAGAGLDDAIREAVERKEGPLIEEFDRLLGQMRVGKSRRQAWEDMAERVEEENLTALVASLVQAEEVGVSIGKALRAQAETVRVRRSLQVREMAATLPVKMLFPLVLFIFPSLFVVLLGPGLIGMTDILEILAGQ